MAVIMVLLLTTLFVGCTNNKSDSDATPYSTNSYTTIADFNTATLPHFQVNSKGQVAWTACSDDGSELYLYENEKTTQITDNMKHCLSPRINDEGQMVWYEYNGKSQDTFSVYYRNDDTEQIVHPDNLSDVFPRQNKNGSIVWERKDTNGEGQIYLLSNGQETQITNSGNNVLPQINDNGQIIWLGSDAEELSIYLYDNGVTKKLNTEPISYFNEYDGETYYLRMLNSKGEVVWVGENDEKTEVFLYSNGNTSIISTAEHNRDPWINDNGQVVWEGYDNSEKHIYIYDAGQTTRLTDNSLENVNPIINNKGQVVWQGGSQIYIYSDNQTIQLSDNNMENVFPQISEGGYVAWMAAEWNSGWYYKNICLVSPQSGSNSSTGAAMFTLKKETMEPPQKPAKQSPAVKIQRNKPEKSEFSFIVCGDSRGEDYSWVAGEKLNKKFLEFFSSDIIKKHNPDFVIFLGDCCTNAHTITGHENLADWKECMKPIYDAQIPLYISKGNHELYNWCAAFRVKFQEEFTDKFFTDQPDNGPDGRKKLCYSFTWGNSYFIVFDSFFCWEAPWWHINDYHYYGDIDKTQLEWIKAQNKTEEATNATHKFILSHAPVYGTEGEQAFDRMKELWQEIDDNKYDMFFGAHEHLYSRKTIDSKIAPTYKNNIPQIVAGAAGAPVDPMWRVKVDVEEWNIHLCYHYVLVEVSGDSFTTKAFKVYKDDSGDYHVQDEPFDVYNNNN